MIEGTAGERERERKRVLIIPSDDLNSHKYGSLILVDWLKNLWIDLKNESINEQMNISKEYDTNDVNANLIGLTPLLDAIDNW